jgi:hypothetical protein
VVDRNGRGDVVRDAAKQKRANKPPRYPICSKMAYTIPAVIADDVVEPLTVAMAATATKPNTRAGNSTWTLKRVPNTAPTSELPSAIMIIGKTFPGIVIIGT